MKWLDSFMETNRRISTTDLTQLLDTSHVGVMLMRLAINLIVVYWPFAFLLFAGHLAWHWWIVFLPLWPRVIIWFAAYMAVYQAVKQKE